MGKPRGGLGGGLLGTQGHAADVETLLRRIQPGGAREEIRTVDPSTVDPAPWQPRTEFKEAELHELANSIRERGVLLPLLVRPKPGNRWELLAGERRQRAAVIAGRQVPVRVLDVPDTIARVITFTENAARENLTAWEEARSVASLRDALRTAGEPHTGEALATLTGWSEGKVSERLSIADRITPAVCERAGIDLHAVNRLPKAALVSAAKPEQEEERARLLRIATGAEAPGKAVQKAVEARKPKPGRPAKPYTIKPPKRGRFLFEIRNAEAVGQQEARAILRELEPIVEKLRERANSEQGTLEL
jgi:ParB family chromosome partitioning protein